jgi:hypothetical protein
MDAATFTTLAKELGLGTLLGTILGWGLTQYGQLMNNRRERRQALGKTLADLLEIRHLALAVPAALKAFSAVVTIPPEAELFLKNVFSGWLLPAGEGLSKRYDESVTAMAEVSPVLSYRLRSKHLVFPWLTQLRALALQHGDKDAAMLMAELEDSITTEYRAVLEELIRDVAWKRGLSTWWETRRTLTGKDFTLPAGIEGKLREAIQRQLEKEKADGTAAAPVA